MSDQTDHIIDGRSIRIFHEDPRYIDEVIVGNEYRSVFDDLVVIDLGCNIGTFSFWIYDKARIIYAIDPSQENIDLMNETITASGLVNIKTFQLAISGTGGMREIDDEHRGTSGSWKLTNGTLNHHEIPTQTLNEFLTFQGIDRVDVLKIDVEGAEHEIFESSSFREAATKIHTIVGEYHGNCPTKILEDNGYLVRVISEKSQFVARRK